MRTLYGVHEPPAQRDGGVAHRPHLRRVLGTPLLTLYAIGIIVGAGIYVLVGSVIGAAGVAAPLSFVLAGLLAGLTGLSYAELAVRYPEAAGAAAYVKEAFGSDALSRLTGLGVAAVVLASIASIARGGAGYVQVFVDWPDAVVAGAFVVLFTAVACLGVRESVGLAAVMALVEIGGLLLVVAAGWPGEETQQRLPALRDQWQAVGWTGIGAGAFIAFFAFIGFESLANMAEEARTPARSLPRAMILSIGFSIVLYAVVATVTVLAVATADLAGSATPLLLVAERAAWFSGEVFAAIALVAIANGVLIDLVMLARLTYGMAARGWLPRTLAVVDRRSAAPVRATLWCGGAALILTVALPFASLVTATSTITLVIFAAVNLALWRLHRSRPRTTGFRAPRFVPPLAAFASLALAAAQAFG